MKQITLSVSAEARLDVLTAQACQATRSQAARWIAAGCCSVNGNTVCKPGIVLKTGDMLAVDVPEAKETQVEKQDIPIPFLYQDEDIAVVNKPHGMVVHPANGNENGTLVNALLFALSDLSGVGGVKRPGIVHRLDKDTSGVLLVAKNDASHLHLSAQLQNREMVKHFLAVVDGVMKEPHGEIDKPIGRSDRDRKKMAVVANGRASRTEWTLLETLRGATLLDVHIFTGRTHQIRVHMQSIGHPVAGDPLYGLKHGVNVPRLMLHAYSLSFTHPRTGAWLSVTAPLPEDFATALAKLRWEADAALPLPQAPTTR